MLNGWYDAKCSQNRVVTALGYRSYLSTSIEAADRSVSIRTKVDGIAFGAGIAYSDLIR